MKNTSKTLFGLAGLALVAAMTVFAVFLPGPGALANSSSVTDTIVVRVVATTPNVTITGPKNGQTFVDPNQPITFNYENVRTVVVTIEYTDPDGNTITEILTNIDSDGQPGSGSIPLDLYNQYGYGDFVIKITGTGSDGVKDEDIIEFFFRPVTGEANQIANTDDVKVDLDYDDNSDEIDYIEINIYDQDGNLIEPLSPIKVPRPDKEVVLPFGEHNLPDGAYTIEITAIDANGNPIKPSHITTVDYKSTKQDEEPIPVPNTGGILAGLNISKSDYLISGLIIFFITGIFGIVIVAKGRDKKRR